MFAFYCETELTLEERICYRNKDSFSEVGQKKNLPELTLLKVFQISLIWM